MLLKISVVSLLCLICCESANILYVMPFTSKSHHIMLKPLGLELARKGHNVTVITGYKSSEDTENYRQITVDNKEIWETAGIKRPNVFTMLDISAEDFHDLILWRGGLGFTQVALETTEVQQFLATNHTFDLVICEQFFQEAFYALAHKYQAPLVLVTTYGNCMRHNILTRNPLQLATVLPEFLDVKSPTSFWARLRVFYFTIYEFVWWKYNYMSTQEELMKKYIPGLPEPMPSLYELQRDASLMLLNSHFSFDEAVAYLPNIVEVGGMHLTRSNTKLPEDLQNLLDNSKHGVVYVNFGSNIRSSELPLDKKNAFLKVFSELNQTILWKWEDDTLNDKAKNIHVRNWLPQKDILAHPNIKVFISHGGLIGTQEAVFNGVPIIGIPIYADQYNNLLQVESLGFGKIQQYHDINEENLRNNILGVINDVSYKRKAQVMSARFKDRPLSALDTAIYWIEYVMRNEGAYYMRNPALKLSWWAYTMLDVYAFLIVVSVASIYLVICVVKCITRLVSVKTSDQSIKNKKKQK